MDLLGENICDHVLGNPPVNHTLSNCPKCFGKGVYGDIVFNNKGKVETINNIDQLKQHIKKILLENTRPSGYGLSYSLIFNVVNETQLLSIKRELNRCIDYLSSVHDENIKSNFFYSTQELIHSVNDVQVTRTSDPRTVNALIICTTVSGKDLTLSLPLRR